MCKVCLKIQIYELHKQPVPDIQEEKAFRGEASGIQRVHSAVHECIQNG